MPKIYCELWSGQRSIAIDRTRWAIRSAITALTEGNRPANRPKWTLVDGNRRGGPATLRAAGPPFRNSPRVALGAATLLFAWGVPVGFLSSHHRLEPFREWAMRSEVAGAITAESALSFLAVTDSVVNP